LSGMVHEASADSYFTPTTETASGFVRMAVTLNCVFWMVVSKSTPSVASRLQASHALTELSTVGADQKNSILNRRQQSSCSGRTNSRVSVIAPG
jgi:hypothetical protein